MKCSSCRFYIKSKVQSNHCGCMGIKPYNNDYGCQWCDKQLYDDDCDGIQRWRCWVCHFNDIQKWAYILKIYYQRGDKAASRVDPQAFNYIWFYKDEFSEELLAQRLEIVKNKCRFYIKIVNELLNKSDNEVNSK